MKITSKNYLNINDFPDIQYWLRHYSDRTSNNNARTNDAGRTLFLCIAVRRQAVKACPDRSRG